MSIAQDVPTAATDVAQALQLAIDHHRAGRLDSAANIYRDILAIQPNHGDANHLLGVIALQKGNLREAGYLIDKACAISPNVQSFQRNRAQVLMAQGRHLDAAEALWASGALDQAETACRQILAKQPRSIDGMVLLARILGDQGRPREAEDVIYSLLELQPTRLSDNEAGTASGRPGQVAAQSFNYIIEVVGTCNLRCPSCPVGNLGDAGRGRGFMDVGLFSQIVDKIRREAPSKHVSLWLFNWGEPLLHPEIARMIRIGREAGFPVVLSSNLNHKHDFRKAIEAGPSQLIISTSGFTQDVYRRTHRRGDIEVVKANMRKLREHMDEFRSQMTVNVAYHLYRHNLLDANPMAAYAQSLGFRFDPTIAFLQPIEKLVQAVERRLEGEDRNVVDLMLEHPILGKILRREKLSGVTDCSLRTNMMTINHDGAVALCCGVYESQNMLGVNFLDLTHEQLQARKYEHDFCKTCFKHGFNSPDIDVGVERDKSQLMMMRVNGLGAKAMADAAKAAKPS